MNNTTAGVLVARFQTPYLHEMHRKLIEYVTSKHNRVVVMLGVSEAIGTRENPLDFETRKRMVLDAYPSVTVIPIADRPTDELWSQSLDVMITCTVPQDVVTIYGGRDSFASHYKGRFNVKELDSDMLPDATLTATQIREEVANQMPLATEDFRRGAIYNSVRRYPAVFPTVDIACWKPSANKNASPDSREVLLCQKPGQNELMFIGGFVNPSDETYQAAAVRELKEETGPIEVGMPEFITSQRMNDWRYNKTDRIITTLFGVRYLFGSPKAQDDIEHAGWYSVSDETCDRLMPVHKPLWYPFVNWLKYRGNN